MSRARDIAAMPGRNADTKSGLIAFFAASAAPSGWLECNGAAVSRTTYADLFAHIGTDYGVGDGSTTFNLPDLRGEFIRGWDNGRGVDTGRVRGSAQAQAMQSHQHSLGYVTGLLGGGGFGAFQTGTGTNTTATGGTETRPRNVALLPCIKT
jgi:phage-related tail fiber protein